MRAQMLVVLLAAWSIGADQPHVTSKKAVDALQGEWVVESMRLGEKDLPPKDRKVAIKGDRMTGTDPGEDNSKGPTFKVDPSKTPATIDLYADGKLFMRGIYAHDGDKLSMCFGGPSVLEDLKGKRIEMKAGDRPMKFDSNQGFLIVMKRASATTPARSQDKAPSPTVTSPRNPITHSAAVYSVSWSPDGKTLASASWDATVKLWEAATGRELASLKGHTGWVWSVAWSPDGKTLASAGEDKTVKLWEAATGKELASLKGHTSPVHSVAWSPDGKTLASASTDRSTASADKTVKLWEAATGKELTTLQGHTSWVWSVAWSPDGKTLASSSGDRTVKVWKVATGKELASLKGHTEGVRSVSWSPDGKTLASASWDKVVKLWEAATGRELATLKGHTDGLWSVSWSPDSKTLASASHDGTVKLWYGQQKEPASSK